MKNGDYVRVRPEGDESKGIIGRIILISRSQQSINVVFERLPAFLIPQDAVIDRVSGRSVLIATRTTPEGAWLQVHTDAQFHITPAAVPCDCRYYGHTRSHGQLIPTGNNQCALSTRHEPCLLEIQDDAPDEGWCFLVKQRTAAEAALLRPSWITPPPPSSRPFN